MPSPIRISADFFESVRRQAVAMNRSVAGQLEYWAKLYRGRLDSADPFARLIAGQGHRVYEVPESLLWEAKVLRQQIDVQAQKDGLASAARMSPFANARVSARIREVRLD